MRDKFVTASNDPLLRRIRGEYLEMPGLRLTEAQARRLWALDTARCADVLAALTESKFLHRRPDGTYVRSSDGSAPVRRSA
jgi:hypothetical protein